jgi:N-acetylmuramic acid 6-phosphate etherase
MDRDPEIKTPLSVDEFLAQAAHFQLGDLPTERPHPWTRELAAWARSDLRRALAAFRQIDRDALAALVRVSDRVGELADDMRAAFAAGNRVFLCGCGATGRLALSLEALWRQAHPGTASEDRVISLMAGGDAALVCSIEGFEDEPAFGARHLTELGFAAGDLLVSCTEGGETPYVIGATELAARLSPRRPWFLYCNPDEALIAVERSRRVLENPAVRKLCIATGPMALSGSTRLQASTVLMLAAGLPLLQGREGVAPALARLADALTRDDLLWLAGLVETESSIYEARNAVLYETDRYAITVLTDTTERAPTFSLAPFENLADEATKPSICYLAIPAAADADAAWRALLARAPRPLEWSGCAELTGAARLLGFDFSVRAREHRARRVAGAEHHVFSVSREGDDLRLALRGVEGRIDVGGTCPLVEHTLLKLALNAHSTLVMGRLGRYQANVMTWVRPSNRKLIDRAIRYIRQLLEVTGGPMLSYEAVARECFCAMRTLERDESIVLATIAAIRAKHAA